jgi:nucleoside phosphorylase
MPDQPSVLVVAATARELAAPDGWIALRCGVGPVEAAAATAAAIAEHRPAAVLHVGIAGARRGSGLAPGTLVLGSEARYADLRVPSSWAPSVVPASPALLAAARRRLPDARTLPIGTSGRVGGTLEVPAMLACDVEAMEGFGVLRAAQRAGVPALEVRAIANEIEEADRARWHFDRAFAAIVAATPILVATLDAEVRACAS